MLLYSLTSNLASSAKSVGVRRYSALMKSSGTFGDDELQEALAKGVVHAATVEARKKTALVCMLSGTAAKGKATLEVVLAGEEPNTYRFTASRKVTVR